jgi:hypothetical protein
MKIHPHSKASLLKKRFLGFFPKGFRDDTYIAWERGYKWNAHILWKKLLNKTLFQEMLAAKKFQQIAKTAVYIESKTNLLFSFEKMALRDAVKTYSAARVFCTALYDLIYGKKTLELRFENYIAALAKLPRKQTRVLTWPLVTVLGFIAKPKQFIFLKPNITKIAAKKYGYDFDYVSRPNWKTYQSYLNFSKLIKQDIKNLQQKDYIDIQSYIWTLGSDEYN